MTDESVGTLADVLTMRHDLLALVQRADSIRRSPSLLPEHDAICAEARALQQALVAICPHPPLVVPAEDLRKFTSSLPLWLIGGSQGPFCWCCTARRISLGDRLSYYTIPPLLP